MAIVEGLDPKAIHETGWGLILPADLDENQAGGILEALDPLIKLRRKQAGNAFRIFSGRDGVRPGESKTDFLRRYGVGPGPVNPNQMPYYLLIVADPRRISFRFQSQLDVQYAVGRIWFEDLEGFRAYAESVRRAETKQSRLPAKLSYFCPRHPGDAFTLRLSGFIQALSSRSAAILPDWQIDVRTGERAGKSDLIALLEKSTPRVILTAGHGLVYPAGDDPRQAAGQGGLVCAGWPGPEDWSGALPEEMCFRADDVPVEADLNGTVYIQYSSFSLGTAGGEGILESGVFSQSKHPQDGALARLPQRLLSLADGRGALAAVGWVDRVWSYSNPDQASREQAVFESGLARLAMGYPVGAAFEVFQERYAETATELSSAIEDVSFGIVDNRLLADQWVAMNNARNLAIFGDPAARISVEVAAKEEQAIDLGKDYPVGASAAPGVIGERVVELEISLAGLGKPGLYKMGMRLAGSEGQEREITGDVQIDLESFLVAGRETAEEYGKRLSAALFDRPDAMELWQQFVDQRKNALSFDELQARLRLWIDARAGELQGLRWETLCDPRDGSFLFMGQETGFTRYLSESDWRALPPLRERGELRALAAIASPSNIRDYAPKQGQLVELDIAGELARVSRVMEGIQVDVLASDVVRPGQMGVENLERTLRKGYDVLYLVCHSWTERLGVRLFLEGADGTAHVIGADDLVQRLRHMRVERRPRLVVLVAPMSAPEMATVPATRPDTLSGLAPALSAAGIAAVLVSPGDISLEVGDEYLHTFFQALIWDGRADRAAAVARQAVYPRPGWWGPALFTRRVDGRLWSGEAAAQGDELETQAELILELSRRGVTDYEARLEFTWGDRENVRRLSRPLSLDYDALRASALDSREYGSRLFNSVFSDDDLNDFLRNAIGVAQMRGENLRMRLVIDPSAPELHPLNWERLFDPRQKAFLAMDEELAFARYMFSSSWRAVELRQGTTLRGLFAVVNPQNMKDYNLEPIDEGTLRETVSNLGRRIALEVLDGPITLKRLMKELSKGYDLFILVCHGGIFRERSLLFLQDEDGQLDRIDGKDFVSMMHSLARLPRLVVLGSNDTAPLAPMFGEIGAPAIVAMLGKITTATFETFSQVFLDELLEDGRVDRAAAVARSAVSDRSDWWVPVLYTRLRDGKVW